MKITIVIPTRNRLEKLYNCIASIITNKYYGSHEVNIIIAFDNREELEKFGKYNISKETSMEVFNNYRVPDFWNYYLKNSNFDVFVCLNDDTLLEKDFFLKLEEAFKNNFPDFDGIVGLNQSNGPKEQCLDSAFCAIGSKYADRFPDRNVYCLDYFRFYADKEIGEYAKSIDKFYFGEEVKIIHLHPAFTKLSPDETHNKVREFLNKDRTTYTKRKQKNLLWGRCFELIEKENNAKIQSNLS